MEPKTLKLLFFIGILLFFGLMELIFRARPGLAPLWKRWLTHNLLSLLNSVIVFVILNGLYLASFSYMESNQFGLLRHYQVGFYTGVIITLIIFDLVNYWWHRINHEIPFLWRFHRVHHSDTEVDVTTSLRFHFGEFLISYVIRVGLVLLLGLNLWQLIIFEIALNTFSQFHHSNIKLNPIFEKYLEYLFISPTLHRAHHAVDIKTGNSNYSVIFSFWDRIFGSFGDPKLTENGPLGISGYTQERVLNLKEVILHPFKKD